MRGRILNRGFQHGALLAPEIAEDLRVRRAVFERATSMDWSWLLSRVKAFMVPKVDAEVGAREEESHGRNVAENPKILRLETSKNEMDIRQSSVARRVRWKQLMAENAGRIDVGLAKAFEADHWDAYRDSLTDP